MQKSVFAAVTRASAMIIYTENYELIEMNAAAGYKHTDQ